MRALYILTICILVQGCSTPDDMSFTRKRLDTLKVSSEVQKYVQAPLPYWANFSETGKCFRDYSVKYLNLKNLNKSFSLDYSRSVHVQHMFNIKISSFQKSLGQTSGEQAPRLQDESFIFYNVYEQVRAGSFDFKLPQYPQASIVWIDPFINNLDKIKETIKSEKIQNGFPVILSQCLSTFEIEKMLQKLKLDGLGIRMISSEMFNNYDKEFNEQTGFRLYLDEILPNKNIILYSTKKPTNIYGINNFIEL